MPPLEAVASSIVSLSLHGNQIKHVPNNYFKNYRRLTSLGLEEMGLTEMPNLSYLNTTLTMLALGDNNISEFESLCDRTYEKLKRINMWNNKLTKIDLEAMLHSWPKVALIALDNNPLETVPDFGSISPREEVVRLRLEGKSNLTWEDILISSIIIERGG